LVVLSRYSAMGASSRLRMLQYLPYLRAQWDVEVWPFFHDGYLQALYRGKRDLLEIAAGYARRLRDACRLGRFDLAWVDGELFPWIPWGMEKLLPIHATPLATDYDDAIFHRYDRHPSAAVQRLLGDKIGAFMRHSDTVLAGNEYLASYARASGARRVHVVPTVVDTARYEPRIGHATGQLTIGWIGTPKTQHYLGVIADALKLAQRTLPDMQVEVRPWSEASEAADLGAIDIGIMPLADSPWERGKCGYKLIQYMASGKPVVASPVGMNRELVEHGINGYLASSLEEWIYAFRALQRDPERAARMGRAGRARVERDYSLAAIAPRVMRILDEAMR
jgi:glycosyltransferase involved in cell wall biosynthesis